MTAPFPATLDDDAGYVSPAHLRTPFRSFIISFDKGIYWLRMPQDTGKTQFVRGIVAKRPPKDGGAPEGIDSAISSGMRSIAVALSPGADPEALVAAVKGAFEAEFGPIEGTDPMPTVGSEAAQAEFAAWLGRLAAAARAAHDKRLLICIDGLEAAASAPAHTVLDVLPTIDQMPDGVVLLLTSRPKAAWADGDAYAKAEAKFAAGPAVSVHELGLEDPAYTDALKRVFKDNLRELLRGRAIATLLSLLEAKATIEKGGRDQRLTDDPTLRDTLKVDWKKLTNKFPRYASIQLPVAPLVPLLDQFDQLWVDVLDRGDRRYRYVRLIVRRLADGSLPVEGVGGLPQGADLPPLLEKAA